MTKLAIIIVSWNTKSLLYACLESILFYPPDCSYEIWVVDNDSTDGSVEMVREQFPEVNLIASEVNWGFAGGNNLALRQVRADYILLLNPDTEVKPEALSALVAFMERQPEAGAAGSRLLNPDDTLQLSCHPMPTLSRELWRLLHLDKIKAYGRYKMHQWDETTPRAVDILQGASLLLRKPLLDKIGLFDETYFMYSEEVDLCRRIQLAGWQLYWVPQSQVVHYGGQSTRQVAAEMFLRLYEGKLLFFRKHYGRFSGSLYKGILFITSLIRLSLTPLVWLEAPPQRETHLTLAKRYWQLLRVLPTL